MENTRRYKRFKVDLQEINGKIVLARYVKIIDISLGGLSLHTDRRMNVNGQYTLKIEGNDRVLTLKGIVVWSLLSESIKDSSGNVIPIYKAGLKFTETGDEKNAAIVDFIKANMSHDERQIDLHSPSGRRLHVRVRLEDLDRAVLDLQENYTVKILSLSGMSIESEHALEIESRLPMDMTLSEDKTIAFWGRVASCRAAEDNNRAYHEIGIDFLDMSEKDSEMLNEYVQSLEGKDSNPP